MTGKQWQALDSKERIELRTVLWAASGKIYQIHELPLISHATIMTELRKLNIPVGMFWAHALKLKLERLG